MRALEIEMRGEFHMQACFMKNQNHLHLGEATLLQ